MSNLESFKFNFFGIDFDYMDIEAIAGLEFRSVNDCSCQVVLDCFHFDCMSLMVPSMMIVNDAINKAKLVQ